MDQQQNQVQGSPTEVIKSSLADAVNTVVEQMQPQINDLASQLATQAVDKSKDLAQSGLKAVQRQPWYLVGAAALLLVGAAVVIGFGAKELVEDVTH